MGLYSRGAVKTAIAPRGRAGYLHPRGASLGRDRGSAQASSSGLVIRAQPATPQRNERVFALLELMLSLRTRPSLSVARTVPKPDYLGPFGAGWRPLSGSLHVPHTNAQFCAARQAWLLSQLPSPLLSSAPPLTADSRLQLPMPNPDRLCALGAQRALL